MQNFDTGFWRDGVLNNFYVISAFSAILMIACSSTPEPIDYASAPVGTYTQEQSGLYETAGSVDARLFLTESDMAGPYHRVNPKARNDGFANTYEIRTQDHLYVAEGTEKARQRIAEITAIEVSQKDSTVEVVGGTVAGKMKNLVDTPVRLVKSGAKRVKAVDSTKDALLLVPEGVGDLAVNLGGGVYEVGKTGVGVAKEGVESVDGDSEDDCSGTDCVGASGKVARKGFDELSGAASKARRRHSQLGTDPYSDNPVLQKEINRVAYSKTFSGIGLSAGLGLAGLPPAVNAYRSGVSLYNRGEKLIEYSDPYERRKIEEEKLKSWGANKDQIEKFYAGKVYNATLRTRLILALEAFPSPEDRLSLFDQALSADTDYLARGYIVTMRYLGERFRSIPRLKLKTGLPFLAYQTGYDTLTLVYHADYLIWSKDFAQAIDRLNADPAVQKAEGIDFVLLGRASDQARKRLAKNGFKVATIER